MNRAKSMNGEQIALWTDILLIERWLLHKKEERTKADLNVRVKDLIGLNTQIVKLIFTACNSLITCLLSNKLFNIVNTRREK